MQCQEVRKKLELYIDNELSQQERPEIEEHIRQCAECQKEFEILKAIHSVSDMQSIPEPAPEYWEQLTQNIGEKINAIDKRPSRFATAFDKIITFLWPESIGYRLAGLTATAVILFVLVRISFFRNGTFEVPAEIATNEIIHQEMEEQVTEAADHDEKSIKILSEPVQQQENTLKKRNKSTGSKPPAISKEGVEPPKIGASKGQWLHKNVTSPPEKKAIPERETDKMTVSKFARQSHASNSKDRLVIIDEKLKPKSKKIKEESFSLKAISADSKLIRQRSTDDSPPLESYKKTEERAHAAEDIHTKISHWDSYLQSDPPLKLEISAKYEKALLLYQLALTDTQKVQIEQACEFYNTHLDFFKSLDNYKEIEAQKNTLDSLLIRFK